MGFGFSALLLVVFRSASFCLGLCLAVGPLAFARVCILFFCVPTPTCMAGASFQQFVPVAPTSSPHALPFGAALCLLCPPLAVLGSCTVSSWAFSACARQILVQGTWTVDAACRGCGCMLPCTSITEHPRTCGLLSSGILNFRHVSAARRIFGWATNSFATRIIRIRQSTSPSSAKQN